MERKVGIQLILKIGQEIKNGADMLIYEPRADVLMHHLGTLFSYACISFKPPSAIHEGLFVFLVGVCVSGR